MTSISKSSTPTTLQRILSSRMLIAIVMGAFSGLPLYLTLTLLQAWMTREGVDLGTIGLYGLLGTPYLFKFIWAPLFDRYRVALLGRRRGWLIITQIAIVLVVLNLSFLNPVGNTLAFVATLLALTFFSASQDIVIDAYRRESLDDVEQGLGAALYANGYKFVGTVLITGGGLMLSDIISFSQIYQIAAGIMALAVLVTLLIPEPDEPDGTPKTLADAVALPFFEYFNRPHSVLILLFIVLYKVGDMMASHMLYPLYESVGFSNTEVGAIVKVFGIWALVFGSLFGGIVILRQGLYWSLWVFGILQAVSTAGFAWLAYVGPSRVWLATVVAFENFSAGLGMAALTGFMASLTNRRFTATQFALLTSLAAVPRVVLTAPTGFMVKAMGWQNFFIFCTLIAIPGLVLLLRFRNWEGLGKMQQTTQ